MRLVPLLFAIIFLVSACARVAPQLRPYSDATPQELIAEVDRQVYSPLTAGMKELRADLRVDISGFYPPEERPEEPVWIPGTFEWVDDRGRFTVRLTPELAPLEPHLDESLRGKEEDLVNRPFSERIREDQVDLETGPDGTLVVVARSPDAEEWRLTVDERFFIPRVEIETPAVRIHSDITYDDREPARIKQIQSRYMGEEQEIRVLVDIEYQMVEDFSIPEEIRYTGSVDAVQFPPFRLRLENVEILRENDED